MTTALVTQTISALDWLHVARRLQASPQQGDITRLIREEDLSAGRIARRLGIHTRSVEKQLERLYKKLGLRSRAALVNRFWIEYWRMKEEEQGGGSR